MSNKNATSPSGIIKMCPFHWHFGINLNCWGPKQCHFLLCI